MQEKWKAIPGWEGRYEASDQGRIRSLARYVISKRHGHPTPCWRKERILKGGKNSRGYWNVLLYREGEKRLNVTVQHLIALTFIGPRPAGMVLCHNNGDKDDNRLENLRYDTQRGNVRDALLVHKTMGAGDSHYRWRSEIDEAALLRLRAKRWTYRELAAHFGVGEGTVGRIIKGTRQRRA